jgi:hypothetical protein
VIASPFPADQIAELKCLGEVSLVQEAGQAMLLIKDAQMPAGITPARCDLLLCPGPRDGYATRLYFAELAAGPGKPNWHMTAFLAGRSWHVYSQQGVPATLRLAEIYANHLRALK